MDVTHLLVFPLRCPYLQHVRGGCAASCAEATVRAFAAVGHRKHTKYLPPMSLSPTKPSKPHTEIEDATPTRKISVAPKTVSSKSLLLDGLPSIAPLERTATMARKSMRKIHPNSVSAVLSSSKKTTRSLVKQS
jgi:hypothetical protein